MFYFALVFLFLTIVFGCASISNSYSSAKQAEAAIEASQTAQLALGGQIIISILLVLVVVILVFIILALLYRFSKKNPITSQHPMNRFLEGGYPALLNTDTQYQFPALQDETKNESSILPSGWGW
jgi:heme/copper-type cytochrome/quinol oxidase subunit 2